MDNKEETIPQTLDKAIEDCHILIATLPYFHLGGSESIATVLHELQKKGDVIKKCLEVIEQLQTGNYIKSDTRYLSAPCCNTRLDIVKDILEDK